MNIRGNALLCLILGLFPATTSSASPCPIPIEPGPATEEPSDEQVAESHRQMVEELQKIAAESRTGNPYFDESALARARTRLQSLGTSPSPRRWRALYALGLEELRMGQIEDSIAHLQEAVTMLSSLQGELDRDAIHRTYFNLAVAYLRFGETANCVDGHTCCSCLYPIEGGGIHQDRRGSQNALACLSDMVKVFPNDASALWLLNLAAMTLGEHPQAVPEPYRIRPPAAEGLDVPRLRNRSTELGVDVFDLSGGAIVDDFDGDHDFDILTSTLTPWGKMSLFLLDEEGRYQNHDHASGLDGITGGLNMIPADYDNDGDLDVLVLRGGWFAHHGTHPNSLLRNRGNATFDDVTLAVGLGESRFPTQTAAWADYDLDGDLDLYFGAEATDEYPYPNELYMNQGDGTFLNVTEKAGVSDRRFTKAVVFGDYDNDRYPDLYVSNLDGENRLYHNQGDGTFVDVAPELSVHKPQKSFPAWFFDFDNDGHLDLFVSSYWADIHYFAAEKFNQPTPAESCALYRNQGDGTFSNVAESMGLSANMQPMGANFGDLDNDGFLDMYLGTGYPGYEGLMPNVLYKNEGGKKFSDVTIAAGLGHLQKGHGVSFADMDQDGDKDVFIQLGGAYPGDSFYNALFENPGAERHWVKLKLQGVTSNRCAIGTQISIKVKDDGEARIIRSVVGTGGSFGANPLLQEIGLGEATRVDALEVFWPASQTKQVFRDVAVDKTYLIVETAKTPKVIERPARPLLPSKDK